MKQFLNIALLLVCITSFAVVTHNSMESPPNSITSLSEIQDAYDLQQPSVELSGVYVLEVTQTDIETPELSPEQVLSEWIGEVSPFYTQSDVESVSNSLGLAMANPDERSDLRKATILSKSKYFVTPDLNYRE